MAKALHDIEWVDSADYGPGDDTEAICACLSSGATLEAAVEAAHEARKALTAELERACSGRPDLYNGMCMGITPELTLPATA